MPSVIEIESSSGTTLQNYCVGDAATCGGKNCVNEIVTDANGVWSAPRRAPTTKTPVCVVQGDDTKCHSPCFGTAACDPGFACANFGPDAGKCVKNDCRNVPCPSGLLCNQGGCVADPCATKTCAANEACRAIDNFKSAVCVKSCADVTCAAGEACKDGVCAATGCGATGCKQGEVCAPGSAGAAGAAGASGAAGKAGAAGLFGWRGRRRLVRRALRLARLAQRALRLVRVSRPSAARRRVALSRRVILSPDRA